MYIYDERPTTMIYINWDEHKVFTTIEDLIGEASEDICSLEEYIEEHKEFFPEREGWEWEEEYEEYRDEEIEDYIDNNCDIVRVDF